MFSPFTTYAAIPAEEPGHTPTYPDVGVEIEKIMNNSARYINQCKGEQFGTGVQEKINKYKEEQASITEKHLVSLLQNITNLGPVNSISTLIYGNPYCIWSSEGLNTYKTLVYGVFSEKELETIIKPTFMIFSGAYALFLTLAIMNSSFKYSINLQNGRRGANFAQDVQMWVVSLFYLSFLWMFINLIFYLNHVVIDSLYGLMKNNGIDTNNFTVLTDLKYENLTDILIYVAEWALTVILNFIYIGRKTILILLIILAPLSAVSMLFESTRKYLGIWIKAFMSVVFINVIHALVFYLVVMLDQVSVNSESYIFKLILMILFIPLTSMAINWIGLTDTSDVGKKMGDTGAGAMMKVASLAKSIKK